MRITSFFVIIILSLVFVLPISVARAEVTVAGSSGQAITFLFVQSAEAVSYDFSEQQITLKNVGPSVTFFSDRPVRVAGHVTLSRFLDLWDDGDDSFAADPPNAEISIISDESVQAAVVVLSQPKLTGRDLQYEVEILDGALPTRGGTCSVFIDGLLGGAGRGAALGAVGGAIAGDAGKGAAIGAAMGGTSGLLSTHRAQRAAASAPPPKVTKTVKVENNNGSFTPVTLTQTPDGWRGPKGEIYSALPSSQQLKKAYGF